MGKLGYTHSQPLKQSSLSAPCARAGGSSSGLTDHHPWLGSSSPRIGLLDLEKAKPLCKGMMGLPSAIWLEVVKFVAMSW